MGIIFHGAPVEIVSLGASACGPSPSSQKRREKGDCTALKWVCCEDAPRQRLDLMNFKVFSNLSDLVCSGSTWSISSDVNCVTLKLCHLLIASHCPGAAARASHGTLLGVTSALITCCRGDCEGVLWLELCPGIS